MVDYSKLAFISDRKIEQVIDRGTYQLNMSAAGTTYERIPLPDGVNKAPFVDALVSLDEVTWFPLPDLTLANFIETGVYDSFFVMVLADDDYIYFAATRDAAVTSTLYFRYSMYNRDLI